MQSNPLGILQTGASLPDATAMDLEFLGHREAIAGCLMQGGSELALVDCGPTTCLPVLRAKLARAGVKVTDLTDLLLTHIHFDHAGATGTLVKENPRLRVYVHTIGAKHLADPSHLIRSATRLWGDSLQQTFGEFLPVPAENVHALEGGGGFFAAGRKFETAYTPGHAAHHISYFDQSTGTAFTGDVTGLRFPGFDFVAPLTPPPDIDLDAWERSLAEIERRDPDRLFLTHFGPYTNVGEHLQRTREGLRRWAERAAKIMEDTNDESDRIARFTALAGEEFRQALPADAAARYAVGASPLLSWYGLSRYWRKRAEAHLGSARL